MTRGPIEFIQTDTGRLSKNKNKKNTLIPRPLPFPRKKFLPPSRLILWFHTSQHAQGRHGQYIASSLAHAHLLVPYTGPLTHQAIAAIF